jgi:hypothetical protein
MAMVSHHDHITSHGGHGLSEARLSRSHPDISLDLKTARTVAWAHRAKVNDAVLAVVSGGLRELLVAHGEPVAGLDLTALVPTTLRAEETVGQVGNEVGLLLMRLPVGESDALGRLLRVRALTQAANRVRHRGI